MPKYRFHLSETFEDPSNLLELKGPLIKIEVSPPNALAQYYQEAKKPIPSAIKGWGIIDTGASTTCVNKNVLKQIGSKPIGTKEVTTPGKTINMDIYPAKIVFPNTKIIRTLEEVFGMKDITLTHNELPIIAFIGREVLSNCIFSYNGKTGEFSLEC